MQITLGHLQEDCPFRTGHYCEIQPLPIHTHAASAGHMPICPDSNLLFPRTNQGTVSSSSSPPLLIEVPAPATEFQELCLMDNVQEVQVRI